MANTTTKQPQDHLKPMPKDVTVHGVTLSIDPSALDDWELLENVYSLQADPKRNGLNAVPILRSLLGDDYQRVKDALRDPQTGRIPVEEVGGFLEELFSKLAPNS